MCVQREKECKLVNFKLSLLRFSRNTFHIYVCVQREKECKLVNFKLSLLRFSRNTFHLFLVKTIYITQDIHNIEKCINTTIRRICLRSLFYFFMYIFLAGFTIKGRSAEETH